MGFVRRVLPEEPIATLAAYQASGGGKGIDAARQVQPDTLIAEIEASGLRGRGGAGFPTGAKWRTVATQGAAGVAGTVVVNGAEGEPGTVKDRAIIRANPYAVLEGAVIAARAVGAERIIVAVKRSFTTEATRLRAAVDEITAAGWCDGLSVSVFEGPPEYLYGEETGLLEAIDGRAPFPRLAPPYKEGLGEPGTAAEARIAGTTDEAPVLVNNVETLANVPAILANGAAWFREVGTDESPGTLVCTVSGAAVRAGVGEVAMGTPLTEVIETVGGGVGSGRRIAAVMTGVSGPLLSGDQLALPLSHEAMQAAGCGLGSGSFIVLDDEDDLVAAVAGASRFLAVESCGQCEPCKRDGLDLAAFMAQLSRSDAEEADLQAAGLLLQNVAVGARCALARQHEAVVRTFLERFPDAVDAHLAKREDPVEPAVVAELLDIEGDSAVVHVDHAGKQPDWTYDETDSGKWPAQLY